MYILETDRLRLRRLTLQDRADIHSVLLDARIMTAMHLPCSEEFADQWLARQIALYETHGTANWYAERKADGAFIGIMGLMTHEMNGASVAELGYLIHPDYQRQGYASEGAKGCMEYAFHVLNADYVTASIAADNTPSMSLAEKLGLFPVEEHIYRRNGENVRYILYGVNRPY